MISIRLSKRAIDEIRPQKSEFTVWDTDLTGFGLRVRENGVKSYVLVYRAGQGRRAPVRKLTIGSVRKLTPEEARGLARRALGSIALGHDPALEKAELRKAITVSELIDTFLDEHVRPKRKPATLTSYQATLNKYIRPQFGGMAAEKLTKTAISAVHARLGETPSAANRTVAVVRSMFSFAQRRGYVHEAVNPAILIDRYPEKSRERFLSVGELARLGAALREAETTGIPWKLNENSNESKHAVKIESRRSVFDCYAIAALRLLLLTGCRLREILGLKWSYIDFDRGIIFLPESKTGRKPIVLNAPTLLLLLQLPRDGEYVVPGARRDRPRHDLKRVWNAVVRRANLTGVRLHDIRHTFASYGAGNGIGLPVIGKLLGHSQASTTQRYAHLASDPLRRASNKIAEHLNAAMDDLCEARSSTEPAFRVAPPSSE